MEMVVVHQPQAIFSTDLTKNARVNVISMKVILSPVLLMITVLKTLLVKL